MPRIVSFPNSITHAPPTLPNHVVYRSRHNTPHGLLNSRRTGNSRNALSSSTNRLRRRICCFRRCWPEHRKHTIGKFIRTESS